jgi:hypothetical protein
MTLSCHELIVVRELVRFVATLCRPWQDEHMTFRLGFASLVVTGLAYITSPISVLLWIMAPVAGLILIDSRKKALV